MTVKAASGARRFTKSANVERDGTSEVLTDYIPTPKSVELIERIVEGLEQGHGGAFSIIGPYGSGKSSAALFLRALVGPGQAAQTRLAADKLRRVDSGLGRRLRRALGGFGASADGFLQAAVVAQREPVVDTIRRALQVGWAFHPRRAPRGLRRVAGAEHLLTFLDADTRPPVLLILDEFGKNLEHYVDDPGQHDLFLLQQLAERAVDTGKPPLVLLTLQHLAFEEYLSLSTPHAQREWAKVQGRFTDFAFSESPRQVRHLIATTLRLSAHAKASPSRTLIRRHVSTIKALGLSHVMEDEDAVSSTHPLHPIAVAALPDLCARYAQNERSLFSFLRSDERASLHDHLRSVQGCQGATPMVRVDALYDYFVESARSQLMAARGARRWLEIESRVRDASSQVEPSALRVLKAVGLLNLVSAGGALRASKSILEYACVDDPSDKKARAKVSEALETLVQQGLVTDRTFADEYRVWSGSDFDLTAAAEQAYRQLSHQSLATTLQRIRPQLPVVAGAFSAKTGSVRAFECVFVDDAEQLHGLQPTSAVYDGVVGLWVASDPPPLNLENGGPRPVVVMVPPDSAAIRRVALEVGAYRQVLEHDATLKDDWVARREIVERLVLAEQRLDGTLWSLFGTEVSGAEYRSLTEGLHVASPEGRLSQFLSQVAEIAFWGAPHIPNEVINREELSSQGAAARRDLMEAMVLHRDHEGLSLEGFGPAVAIYRALLANSGIHREREGVWCFGDPKRGSPLARPWRLLAEEIEGSHFQRIQLGEVLRELSDPPFGMRSGPLPVLLTALLLAHEDDVAIYEHGVYQPLVVPDLLERLAKNPQNFEVRSFGLKQGGRQTLVAEMMRQFRLQPLRAGRRNTTVLSVVRPLLQTFRELPDYAKKTRHVSGTAEAVRGCLLTANEPDQLLFAALPKAVGFEPFGRPSKEGGSAKECVAALTAALRELNQAYQKMMLDLRQHGAELLSTTAEEFRDVLRGRATRLVDVAGNPTIQSFLLRAQDENQSDEDWFQGLAMSLSGSAPRAWGDDEVVAFRTALRERIGAMQRLEFLYPASPDATHGARPYSISLTSADGHERVLMGAQPLEASIPLQELAARAVTDAKAVAGPGGPPALVRSLIEILAPEPEDIVRKA